MTGFWDDADVISAYSRADAIADGTLVDITTLAAEAGFVWPVAMTRAAWADAVEWSDVDPTQDETGRLWDVLTILRWKVSQRGTGPRLPFSVLRIPQGGTVGSRCDLVCIVGPGDTPDPVLTITTPNED